MLITAPSVKTLIAGDAPRVTTLDGTRPPGALLARFAGYFLARRRAIRSWIGGCVLKRPAARFSNGLIGFTI